MSNSPLVEVKNLSVRFPVYGGILSRKVGEVRAVDDISFSIGRSQIVGLVGESGCGKTTVGRAMINILKYIAADVEVEGQILYHFDGSNVDFAKLHPRSMREFRSRVQMIFQDPFSSLNPNTPDIGRFSSGKNLPMFSEISNPGVSKGSKPYS